MDNQHRKITGYRELTQPEIDLMNEIKEKGKEIEALIDKVNVVNSSTDEGIDDAVRNAKAFRSSAIAATELQTGLMWLTRAVAKPLFF